MGDLMTTSYQAEQIAIEEGDREQNINIFSRIPDQFTRYENKTYNPLDFYTSSGEFNLSLFNQAFREEQLRRIDFYRKRELERLEELNKQQIQKPNLHQLSIGQHLINIKDTFFGLIKDLENEPLSTNTLLKNNRLFYIGLLFVIIFILYLIINNLLITSKIKSTYES
uniref:Uncharacterized protein n=1 Tax=viral metagenome TaxID=1070528 RepID=A0A6C0LS75_9ZZZZ